jgi:HD-GYP domain-containing protein (c-di-GMP phosphodiesterase class II)
LNESLQKQQIRLREKFFVAFNRLAQMAKIHQDNNQVIIECIENFLSSLIPFGEEDTQVTIQVFNDRFVLQGEKFIYHRETANLISNMLQYFEKRGLHGLRFSTGLNSSSFNQVLDFMRTLNSADQQEEPLDWLTRKIAEKGITWVKILDAPEKDPWDQDPEETPSQPDPEMARKKQIVERRKRARKTYSHAMTSVKDVLGKLSSNKQAGVRRTIRIVQNMVETVMVDEPVLMGLSTIHDYDDYTCTHSVNVSILALCLGKRIGLSRKSLGLLGTCGLFHDLGKVDVPNEIINKPGKLNNQEFEEIQKHCQYSVRQILKLKASPQLKEKIILPPFEHHLKYDLTGYPRTHRKKPVSLFGRILTIVDVYDAITTPRIYCPVAESPSHALGLMLRGSGKFFDPILLKVFINMLGVYPMSTLLELDNGDLGLVMETPDESPGDLPRVQLLLPDGQGGYEKGKVVDLSEKDPRTDKYLINIVQSLNPATYGIQPVKFFL